MSQNRNRSIVPSKTQMPVRPCLLIPAQTWTFMGCLGLKKKVMINYTVHYILSCDFRQELYFILYLLWFRFRCMPDFPTAEPPMVLYLYSALIRPYNVIKTVSLVLLCPLQPLDFISLTYHLAIGTPPKCPP